MADIRFVRCDSAAEVAVYLASRINNQLAKGESVVWFLSGGSSVDVAVKASNKIKQPTNNLIITLVDERYGPPRHEDSNWQQLAKAGFDIPGALMKPILKGLGITQTAAGFDKLAAGLFANSNYKIALLGMGGDGHTAGLLPGSTVINSPKLADYYGGPDYQRITLTPAALVQLDEAVVFARGESKHAALDNLSLDLDINQQPAQILKKIKKVTVFNDYKGEKL